MGEQGYNKAKALACLDTSATKLRHLRELIEGLPDVHSAKVGTDIDACDGARIADDLADQCKDIGRALGFGTITDDIPC